MVIWLHQTLKMMLDHEVSRSLELDKTNLFLLVFLHATGLELAKKRIAILTYLLKKPK